MKSLLIILGILTIAVSCNRENIYTSKQYLNLIKKNPQFAHVTVPFFSFRLPVGWRFDFGSIYDENENKVGSFNPQQVMTNRKCFERDVSKIPQRFRDPEERKVTKELTLNNRKVVLQTWGAYIDGARQGEPQSWYIYSYCIMENNKVFEIRFYDYKMNSEKQKVFEEIVQSAQF